MNRRGFLQSILALGVAPYVVTTAGVLMPVRQVITIPDVETLWIQPVVGSDDPLAQVGWVSAKTVVHGKEYGACFRVLATEDGPALRDYAKRGLLTVLRDGGVLT